MYHIIANPSAQSGHDSGELLRKLEGALRERSLEFETLFTRGARDGTQIARRITGTEPAYDKDVSVQTIIVLGGDGTINEVLNGIRDFRGTKFGFLPVGSSNDFARGLGIPDMNIDPSQDTAIQKVCEGNVLRQLDLGMLHYDTCESNPAPADRIFAISAGIGFDAAICEEVSRSCLKAFFNRLHLGKATYGVIGLKQLLGAPSARCEITLSDGTKLTSKQLIFAAVMNTSFEGGGYRFAPDAVPDDGLLNLAAIGDITKLNALAHFPAAHRGRYYHVKGVRHCLSKSLHVETSAPLWVHTDGEVAAKASSITIQILPGVLQLIQ